MDANHHVKQRPWQNPRATKGSRQDIWLAGSVVSLWEQGVIILIHSQARTVPQINILLKERTERWFYSCQMTQTNDFFSSLWFNSQRWCCAFKRTPLSSPRGHTAVTVTHIHTQLAKVVHPPPSLPPSAYNLRISSLPLCSLGLASAVDSGHLWNGGTTCEGSLIPK